MTAMPCRRGSWLCDGGEVSGEERAEATLADPVEAGDGEPVILAQLAQPRPRTKPLLQVVDQEPARAATGRSVSSCRLCRTSSSLIASPPAGLERRYAALRRMLHNIHIG